MAEASMPSQQDDCSNTATGLNAPPSSARNTYESSCIPHFQLLSSYLLDPSASRMETFYENVKHDIELHNLTIWCQWSGVVNVLPILVTSSIWLYTENSGTRSNLYIFFYSINTILFSFLPISVEYHRIRSSVGKHLILCGIMWIISLLEQNLNETAGIIMFQTALEIAILFITMRPICKPEGLRSIPARMRFYIGLALGLSILHGRIAHFQISDEEASIILPRLSFLLALPTCTVLMYAAASFRKDNFVFSKTLGGSGQAPMELVVPGSNNQWLSGNNNAYYDLDEDDIP